MVRWNAGTEHVTPMSLPALNRFDGVPDRFEPHAERQRTHHSCQTLEFSCFSAESDGSLMSRLLSSD
jgi:hypothetical protein